MEQEQQKKNLRKLQPENLIARLEKLPLEEKISTLTALKNFIKEEKERLENQLALINT